jgi:hypothetical protein
MESLGWRVNGKAISGSSDASNRAENGFLIHSELIKLPDSQLCFERNPVMPLSSNEIGVVMSIVEESEPYCCAGTPAIFNHCPVIPRMHQKSNFSWSGRSGIVGTRNTLGNP